MYYLVKHGRFQLSDLKRISVAEFRDYVDFFEEELKENKKKATEKSRGKTTPAKVRSVGNTTPRRS